jgi:hypothetical protein
MADVHVFHHPLAKRANASFDYGGSRLSGGCKPHDLQTEPARFVASLPLAATQARAWGLYRESGLVQ